VISVFAIVSVFFIVGSFAQIPDTTVFKTMKSKDTIQVSKDWVPQNIEECFKRLDEILPDSVKINMKTIPESKMVIYHRGLGTHLRNTWALWRGGKLAKYFNKMEIFHPDDMSGIILTSYWRKLNGRPIDIKNQVKYYKAYWERQENK